MTPLATHQAEIEANLRAWRDKPLLREVYAGFYRRILELVDPALPGRVLEIGSGVGGLKAHYPTALASDLFPNPWLDLACDGYELPFRNGALSHVVLFDVFHHLCAPEAFLLEARRVLAPAGRLLIFEPFISLASFPVYAWCHHEPVAWRAPISRAPSAVRPRDYYAAQGNATRLFFGREFGSWPPGWTCFHASAFSCFHYLLSGGYSRRALYPASWLGPLRRLDEALSRWPRAFGGRCLIGLRRA